MDQRGFDRLKNGVMRCLICGITLAQKNQHHRTGPDHADRVGDILAIDIGRRTVHRLEQRGKFALGIDIGRRRDADGAGPGRAQVGENVAKQVRGYHHIKAFRAQDKARTGYRCDTYPISHPERPKPRLPRVHPNKEC